MAELEAILHELERGDVDLDRLAGQVRRAAELVRFCRGRLDDARTEVTRIVADLDAEPDLRPRRPRRRRDAPPPSCRAEIRRRRRRRRGPATRGARRRDRAVGRGRPRPGRSRSRRSVDSCSAAASACVRPSATGPTSAPAATRPTGATVDAGAAFELLHAFALMHDDVMDGSDTRRGTPTIHVEFTDQHARRRVAWRGPTVRRGRRHPRRRPGRRLRRPPARRHTARRPPGVGRAEDRAQHRPVPRRARHRTGRHRSRHAPAASPATSPASTRSSGRCTSAPRWPAGSTSCAPPLSAYGDPLGEAFQLRDDVLGSFGDERGHRQAGRRRPPRGQADPDAGHRRRPGRRATGTPTALLDRVGAPDLTVDEVATLQALLEQHRSPPGDRGRPSGPSPTRRSRPSTWRRSRDEARDAPSSRSPTTWPPASADRVQPEPSRSSAEAVCDRPGHPAHIPRPASTSRRSSE